MKGGFLSVILIVMGCTHLCAADDWAIADLILERDASGNIEVPPHYWADQESAGRYRLDGLHSRKELNCIFLEFHKELKYPRKPGVWASSRYGSLSSESKVMELWIENPLRPKDTVNARLLRVIITAENSEMLQKLKEDAMIFIKHNGSPNQREDKIVSLADDSSENHVE